MNNNSLIALIVESYYLVKYTKQELNETAKGRFVNVIILYKIVYDIQDIILKFNS